jgi:acetyltransferase
MSELMEVGRSRGLDRIHGEVLASNHNMMGLMKRLGFEIRTSPDDADLKLVSHSL